MTTFDAWEIRVGPPEPVLYHSGIKGMKHGHRRFQNPDGTWTPLGLKERREREGFGESRKERRAARKVAKLERKAAKAENKMNRKAARKEALHNFAEKQRKKKLSNLTDKELQEKIKRATMEQQYKELTRSKAVENGMKLVGKYFEYKAAKETRAMEFNRQKIEMARIQSENIKARERTRQTVEERKRGKFDEKIAQAEAIQAGHEARRAKTEKKKNILQAKKDLQNAKTQYRGTTIMGAVGKALNKHMPSVAEGRAERKNLKRYTNAALRKNVKIKKKNDKKGLNMTYWEMPDERERRNQKHLENLAMFKASNKNSGQNQNQNQNPNQNQGGKKKKKNP